MTHTKQLLLVTFCDTTAGIGASFWIHRQTDGGQMHGRTDRRGSRYSYLDINLCVHLSLSVSQLLERSCNCLIKLRSMFFRDAM